MRRAHARPLVDKPEAMDMLEHQDPAARRDERVRAEVERLFPGRDPDAPHSASDDAATYVAYQLGEMNRKLDRIAAALEALVRSSS
jgi:hypothetical protein